MKMRPHGRAPMRLSRYFTRRDAVHDTRRMLLRHAWPRLEMATIVGMTGLCGFFASWLMLQSGMARMALRYPAAVLVAYVCFLGLLWLWMRARSHTITDALDPTQLDLYSSGGGGSGSADGFSGHGGDFGGGGATGTFDAGGTADAGSVDVPMADTGGFGDLVGDAAGGALQAEEGAIPLLALLVLAVVLLGGVFAAFHVVFVAPSLFAELLVDGFLSYSLFRRMRRIDSQHWLMTAVSRTALTFLVVALFLSVGGYVLARFWPGAHSLGDVLRASHASTLTETPPAP